MCNTKIATQVAAYFLWKEGGTSSTRKLVNLMYLAERTYILNCASRLTEDELVSLKYGPALFRCQELLQQGDLVVDKVWNSWLKTDESGTCSLKKSIDGEEAFDHLNQRMVTVLESVYKQYGHFNKWDIYDLDQIKKIFPEWKNPANAIAPISIRNLLTSHGKSAHEIREILDFMEEKESLRKFLGVI